MGEPLLLGLDIGTSRLKALLIDENGRSVGLSAQPTPFRQTAEGTETTAAELLGALRSTIAGLGDDLARVAGVGIASLGESGTFIHEGEISANPIIAWHDPRGTATAEHLDRVFGAQMHDRTGKPARFVTSIAKIGWLHAAGAGTEGEYVGVAGLLTWALTGSLGQEPSLAATSGAYDPVLGTYLDDVLAAAGVPDVRFAPVSLGGTPHGRVHGPGSAWSGLPQGIPVSIAGHDHLVGALGAGTAVGEVADSMGSGEPVLAALPPGLHPLEVRRTMGTVRGVITVSAWPGGNVPAVLWEQIKPGLGLARLTGVLGLDRDALELAAASVGEQQPWSEGLLWDLENAPEGSGEFAAVRAAARLATPPEVWAAALDGYAELTGTADARLRAHTGSRTPTVVFGGGLRSRRWLAAKQARSLTGLKLVDEPEATARGAALLAGQAAGVWGRPGDFPGVDGQLVHSNGLPIDSAVRELVDQRCQNS